MNNRRRIALLAAITLVMTLVTPSQTARAASFTNLDPGGPPDLAEQVTAQFVFVGSRRRRSRSRASLPSCRHGIGRSFAREASTA